MKHRLLILAAIVPVLISCNDRKNTVMSCDIVRNVYCPDSTYIPLLQGNGVFGGMIESFGLQTRPSEASDYAKDNALFNKTRSMRAGFGADYLAPVARVYWKDGFEGVNSYSQRQSFYDGVVSTSFSHSQGDVKVRSWFDPEVTDAMFFEVSSSSARDIVIESFEKMTTHYDQKLFQTVEISGDSGNWTVRTESPQGNYTYFVHSGFSGRVEDGKLVLSAKGNSYISIVCNNDVVLKPSASLRAARSYWHKQWNDYSFVFFGQENEQKAWVRFMAQILSNFTDKVIGLAPPMGLSGNGWPFAFPQDISYILPVFISSGHVELARSIVEYFAAQIPQLEEYTSRLVGQKGIFCPWTMPYTTLEGFHDPQTPNIFFYETHNSGYLCRMAYETSLALNDESWTKSFAYPLIKGCAEFYRSVASKGNDGYWHIFMDPGMGQDETGGQCQMDYLCSLYSAQYCFETAVRCGLDDDGSYARILQDSLAFNSIKSPDGYYFSCKGSGPQDFGHQKHPVQLNPLAYLPVSNSFSPESFYAYEHRYDITERAEDPYFFGWSLGEFLLSSTRRGDRFGWQKDWDNMLPSVYTDPDFTQIYETSSVKKSSYYLTTQGLVLQSLLNNIADEWSGDIRLAGCVPPSWDKPVRFSSVFSKTGVLMSGTVKGQEDYDVTLKAWKDCSITVDGQSITLKKGQKAKVSHRPEKKDILDEVDTRVGTSVADYETASQFGFGGEQLGNCMPCVTSPNGMTSWTAQTRISERKGDSPYYYFDPEWMGFRSSHWMMGSATQDYGSFYIIPGCGGVEMDHSKEIARPDYYRYGNNEMTALSHTSIMKMDCDSVVFGITSYYGDGNIEVDHARREVRAESPVHRIYAGWGKNAGYSAWTVTTFDRPIIGWAQIDDGSVKIWFEKSDKPLMAKMALSFTSLDKARSNMEAEIPYWDFDAARNRVSSEWEELLGMVEIEADEDLSKQFYTSLWRSYILPRCVSDCGDVPEYDEFSLWDTFRALHPLLTVLRPETDGEMIESFLHKYDKGGWLPIFPCWGSYTSAMIGDHGISMIADAYTKGIRNFDVEKAWKAIRQNCFEMPDSADYADGKGRRALFKYLEYKYLPLEVPVWEAFHQREQSSRTLEYAYDDWCASLMARDLGSKEDYDKLAERASYWRNVFDPVTKYPQGRHADGTFLTENNYLVKTTFVTEATPCHYSWFVPHDVEGLIDLLGEDEFEARLDSMFVCGRYWHGNEPCHHVAYLYSYIGKPEKTAAAVKNIMHTEYHNTPGGLSGNDDCGQMSAWYVFSALGFYPVCPGSAEYALGGPSVWKAVLHLDSGKDFTIRKTAGKGSAILLDGKPVERPFLKHSDLADGGELTFVY